MSGRLRYPWWLSIAAAATAALIVVLGRTWRIVYRDVLEYDAVLAKGECCLFAIWHARILPFAFTHRGRGIAVLVSQHRDGEWIARVVARLGFVAARGSSTRGGEEGVREMIDFAARRHVLGLTPDGPRGPAERVKGGLVYLASRTGFPVVPIAAAADRSWCFRSWDRLRLPKPFARVVVAYGAPIAVPPELSGEQAEALRLALEQAIADLTRRVARQAGEQAA